VSCCGIRLRIEIEEEEDGRWLTDVVDLPGVMAYGNTAEHALGQVKALALRVLADRLERGEIKAASFSFESQAA
jgi:predicted RNase H-like HicB family nuclease